MRIGLIAIVGFILLMLASGAYIFIVGCYRGKRINWLDRSDVERTSFAQYYSRIVAADRFLKVNCCQDVFVTSGDGLRLHGLWVPAEGARGTVILMHGYRSTYLVDFSMALEFYLSAGFNLLIPDQRAHGKSDGRFITFGVKESEDLLTWIGFHNRNFGLFPVFLHGLSMGASTVLYVLDQPLTANVRGAIADCGFTSPKEILSAVYKRVIHLPPCLSMWAVDLFTRIFAGFSINQKHTQLTLAHSNVPVFMIHGKEDGFVPCEMSQRGYQSCGGKKRLLLVDGADHGVSFLHDREGYIRAVNEFINENIDGVAADK